MSSGASPERTGYKPGLVKVPARFVRGVLRLHGVCVDPVFYPDGSPVERSVLDRCENRFTGQELELLVAAFARMDDKGTALFKSRGEWIALASGKKSRVAQDYGRAIGTLQVARPFLDKVSGRNVLQNFTPVRSARRVPGIDRNGKTRPLFAVFLAPEICGQARSFHPVPLALGSLLRAGGLVRVETAQIKLCWYIITRINAAHRQTAVDLENLIEAAGLCGHTRNRHRDRAHRQIFAALAALKNAGMLCEWSLENGPKNRLILRPDMGRFSMRRRSRPQLHEQAKWRKQQANRRVMQANWRGPFSGTQNSTEKSGIPGHL